MSLNQEKLVIRQKCISCETKTDLFCNKCHQPICAKHSYHIVQRLYCAECFLEKRNEGLKKIWGLFLLILVAAALVAIFWQN
jgi:late competence protein required for DNA uptake (superfamily II DNA/RNA helicase)